MKNLKRKYFIKIPENTKIVYCDKKNLITFIGVLSTKSLNLKIKLVLMPFSKLIVVTDYLVDTKLITDFKTNKKIQGTTTSKIRQILIEINYVLSKRLKLVGVGYRVFSHESLNNQIYLKLGYSHSIYFKIPNNLNVDSFKFTKIFISGNNSYDNLTQTIAQIRDCKLPEPYKGKGVLYDQETIILKKGKKI